MTDRFTAIVPARSGSSRLPGKNVKLISGRPLIFHTLDALLNQPAIDRVVFSTDIDDYISLVREEYGDKVTCIRRPERTATDTAKVTEEVARLGEEHSELFPGDWFGLFLPTAPLRTFKVAGNVIDRWLELGQPVFSCHRYDFPVQFAFTIDDDGKWVPLLQDDSPMVTGNTRSQDLPTTYRPNGAAYITRWDIFNKRHILYDEAVPVQIPEIAAVDVDDALTFKIAEAVMAAVQSGEL